MADICEVQIAELQVQRSNFSKIYRGSVVPWNKREKCMVIVVEVDLLRNLPLIFNSK